jgi:endonuclease-8
MRGAWQVVGPEGRWRRAPHRVRAVVRTPTAECVCYDAPTVELLDERDLRTHPVLARLGPDLATEAPDLDEALDRFDALPGDLPIGVALLDQRVAGGIGNVFKSEVLWAVRVDPRAPLLDVDRELRLGLLAEAARLLRANLGPGPRRTVPEGLAVYRRAGRACRRCGATIVSFRQGTDARVTYACPSCQTAGR